MFASACHRWIITRIGYFVTLPKPGNYGKVPFWYEKKCIVDFSSEQMSTYKVEYFFIVFDSPIPRLKDVRFQILKLARTGKNHSKTLQCESMFMRSSWLALHTSWVPIRQELDPVSVVWGDVFLLPPVSDASLSQDTPSIKFACTRVPVPTCTGERHCESKVSCQITQNNIFCQVGTQTARFGVERANHEATALSRC